MKGSETMKDTLRQKKERSIWEKMASRYDRQVMSIYGEAYGLSIERVLAVIDKKDAVLEMGCGTGIISLGIAPRVERVVGTDISPKMISLARAKAEQLALVNVDFQVGDSYSLPFEDGSFDTVLLFNTLHFLKEPNKVLQEAYRLLKTGGYFALATDCFAEPVPFLTRIRLSAQNLLKNLGIIPFMWNYRKEDLHKLLKDNSFVIEDSEVLHQVPVNYYLLGRKTTL